MIQPPPFTLELPTFNLQQPPPPPRGINLPNNDSGIDLGSNHPPPPNQHPLRSATAAHPTFTFTKPEQYNSPHVYFEHAPQAIQQGGLLAMMYPPLDGLRAHPQQVPLPIPSPIYGMGGFASPTDNEYFPYLDAGWQGDEMR